MKCELCSNDVEKTQLLPPSAGIDAEPKKVCMRCYNKAQTARLYEEDKNAEVARQQEMIKNGLCDYCAIIDGCNVIKTLAERAAGIEGRKPNSKDFDNARCKPLDRCTGFIDKSKLNKKEKDKMKLFKDVVPMATHNKKHNPSHDVYSWIMGLDLSDEDHKEAERLITEIDDERELKKQITLIVMKGRKRTSDGVSLNTHSRGPTLIPRSY
jgi:hypothetical protein